MRRGLVVALLALVAVGCGSSGVSLAVSPGDALLDAPFHVRVTGLAAHGRADLKVTEQAFPRGTLSAQAPVRADASGVVDLRSNLPALVEPVRGTANGALPRFTRRLRVSLLSGGRVVARTTAVRSVAASSVAVEQERPAQTGFYGEYLRPRGARARTAVLLLGGSEGGMPSAYTAGLLAAHGFPVLALAYFSEPGLPSEPRRIPLEYFRGALDWLARQPEASASRIVVLGVSRGGELALLLGSTFPEQLAAVAAYVPSDTVHSAPRDFLVPAWTYRGKPVAEDVIRVERIRGPVFVVGAGDDELWSSGAAVAAIARRLRAHGRPDLVALSYPLAGHGTGLIAPGIPSRPLVESRYGTLYLGGSPAADAAARADAWPKLLRFLARLPAQR